MDGDMSRLAYSQGGSPTGACGVPTRGKPKRGSIVEGQNQIPCVDRVRTREGVENNGI